MISRYDHLNIMTVTPRAQRWPSGIAQFAEETMTIPMRASLTAIGRQLQAGYRPILATPLPRKLEKLLAQLTALDAGK